MVNRIGKHSLEFIDNIRQLAPTMSAAQIGVELGVSRNTVIGVCARKGIALPGSNNGNKGPKGTHRRRAISLYRPKSKHDWNSHPPPMPEGERPTHVKQPLIYSGAEDAVAELIGPASSVEARQEKIRPHPQNVQRYATLFAMIGPCRYLSGESPPYIQCDAARVEGYPYCAEHKARCYRKPEPRVSVRGHYRGPT